MKNNKVVLAFSGGLDTSYCVKYLKNDQNLEVHTVTINTGGFTPDELAHIEKTAIELGAASHKNLEVTEQYYTSCVRFLIFGNILKNGTYPLSVSAERAFQALEAAKYAKQIDAVAIAHGSTGAGNDQVRFDMIFRIIIPDVTIITPIRTQRLSRQAEIEYLKSHGVVRDWAKAEYSINQGLWGTSVGGRETLGSRQTLPEAAYPTPATQTQPQTIALSFEQGEPTALNGQAGKPVNIINALNNLAAPYGIGRDVHVGDTVIGIKGRVGFEAAAPLIIIKAHHLLEKHTLTKWQLLHKQPLADWYGHLLHEGLFQEPALRDMEAFMLSTQKRVTGTVYVQLHPHRFVLEGLESPYDLMASSFGQYGEMNNAWDGSDVEGFAKILSNQQVIWHNKA